MLLLNEKKVKFIWFVERKLVFIGLAAGSLINWISIKYLTVQSITVNNRHPLYFYWFILALLFIVHSLASRIVTSWNFLHWVSVYLVNDLWGILLCITLSIGSLSFSADFHWTFWVIASYTSHLHVKYLLPRGCCCLENGYFPSSWKSSLVSRIPKFIFRSVSS